MVACASRKEVWSSLTRSRDVGDREGLLAELVTLRPGRGNQFLGLVVTKAEPLRVDWVENQLLAILPTDVGRPVLAMAGLASGSPPVVGIPQFGLATM